VYKILSLSNLFKLGYKILTKTMTQKRIYVLLMLLVPIISFGQPKLSKDFKVTTGTPYPVVDAKTKDYFSDGKGHTISVKTDGEKVTIQRYDVATMKELGRKEYEDFPPINKIQKTLQIGDRLFYIFSSFNKKARQEDLYSREINMNDGTFAAPKALFSSGKEATVSSYIEPATMTMFGLGAPVRFEVHKSFDNSKMLIRYRLKPEEKDDSKNYDIIGFYVFDTNMEKQWGGEVKMPYTEKEMNNLAYGVSKDGKAFMLAYINASKQFELLTIGSDLKVNTSKIDIDGSLYFQQLNLQEDNNGNLACAGFYANGVDFKMAFNGAGSLSLNTNGILYFTLALDGKVLNKYNFEFPIDLINQYESKREQDKNEKREEVGKAGIRDLKQIAMNIEANGNVTIVGEQQYLSKKYVVGKGIVTIWVYGDMVATKFDKSGKLLWMKKLPKTQTGEQGKGGLSVRYLRGKDAHYILFLDNIKNADIGINEVPAAHQDGKGGFLTAYKIDDATGNIEKHNIFDIKDINGTEAFQFRTTRIFDAADKTFMLEVYIKGKEDTMVKMELTK
jgi:hypothetical protein